RIALAGMPLEKGVAEVRAVEDFAFHQAAHAEPLAGRVAHHQPEAVAHALLDVGSRILERTHVAVADIADPTGIIEQLEDEASVGLDHRRQRQPGCSQLRHAGFSSRATRLEVSQRRPPWAWMSP